MASGDNKKQWTLLELVNWTTEYFEEKGIENARLNAELLLSHCLGMKERVMLYARFDRTVQPQDQKQFRKLVKARADRQPLQYVIGSSEFYGREFRVDESVLVPRPETELLVDKCLEKIPGEGGALVAADIGTGSGAIAVTLACEREELRVVATDSSSAALDIARANAAKHGVDGRVGFVEGHLCDPIPDRILEGDPGLGLVASNPPYVPGDQLDELQPEVSEWEPRQALDGGPDGLDVIRELVPSAAGLLRSGGWFVLEIGQGQSEAVREIIEGVDSLESGSLEAVHDDSCERILAVPKI